MQTVTKKRAGVAIVSSEKMDSKTELLLMTKEDISQ